MLGGAVAGAACFMPTEAKAKLSPANESISVIEKIPFDESSIAEFITEFVQVLNLEYQTALYTYEATVQFWKKENVISIIICHGIGTHESTQFWFDITADIRKNGISKESLREQIRWFLRQERAI